MSATETPSSSPARRLSARLSRPPSRIFKRGISLFRPSASSPDHSANPTAPVMSTPKALNVPERIKRLCILSDGTWNDLDMSCPTNISFLATSIQYEGAGGIQQLVHYDSGVGTEVSGTQSIIGGLTGQGIDLNIRQLYTYLSLNYHPGDEIYLFGFSRGAYTVRSLAGLINHSGLVHRDHLYSVNAAYDLYRSNKDPDNETARQFREKFGERVPIKLLACFDTVGALGLPWTVPWPLKDVNEQFRFHDTKIAERIEHAVHLVSIDEDRKAYRPTLMQPHATRDASQVTQIWFPGTHSGVGGGNENEKQLSQNTLRFLVDEMKRRGIQLEIDESRIPEGRNFKVVPRGVAFEKGVSMYKVMKVFAGSWAREIPSLDLCHEVTIQRYQSIEAWRPLALEKFKEEILGKEVSFQEG